MATSTESTVAFAALTAASLGQQMFSFASNTLKFAATALRIQQQQGVSWSSLPEYSLDEVSWHVSPSDCWIVVYDKVYNVSDFLIEHPGGYDVIMEHAGRDATIAFRSVGHSADAVADLERFLIGILPPKERMYLRQSA